MLFSPSRVIYTHAERHRTPAREDKAMTTYKTNHATTTKSMTEWYFGKAFFWQDGTGYLTIQLH